MDKKLIDYIIIPTLGRIDKQITYASLPAKYKILILCQPKAKLEAARAKLKNTKYYSYWEKEYLKEILNK